MVRWCVQKHFQNHYRNQVILLELLWNYWLQINKISALFIYFLLKSGLSQDARRPPGLQLDRKSVCKNKDIKEKVYSKVYMHCVVWMIDAWKSDRFLMIVV